MKKAGLLLSVVATGAVLLASASASWGEAPTAQMRICTEFTGPPIPSATFGFALTPPSGAPDHLGPGCSLAFGITAGTSYALSETLPAGWLLASATCSRTNGTTFEGTTGTLDGTTISGIEAQPGDLVGCTFVQTAAPTTKEQCNKGGWHDFGLSGASVFKNQGDCVSYVATGGKNQP